MISRRRPPQGDQRRVQPIGDNLRGVVTNKKGVTVQFESELEHRLILLLERDHSVANYRSQPEKLLYIDDKGKRHTYIPDFKVWLVNGIIQIHEVTVLQRLENSNHLQTRTRMGRQICESRSWQYILHTDVTLPQGAELADLIALFRFRARAYQNSLVAQAAHRILEEVGRIELSHLVSLLASELDLPRGQVCSALGHMLWHKQLEADFSKLIFIDASPAPNTFVWLPDRKKGE